LYLFIDTETSGPNPRKDRSVQIAWVETDLSGRTLVEASHIVRPVGFEIGQGAAEIHGITTERARRDGETLHLVLSRLRKAFSRAQLVIGHNISFDLSILSNDFNAIGDTMPIDRSSAFCTMSASRDWCALKEKGPRGRVKNPKLTELYRICFGREFHGAHDALRDVRATKECFFHLRSQGVINVPAVAAASIDDKQVRAPWKPRPDSKIATVQRIEINCTHCNTEFAVTLVRYEVAARCPQCSRLTSAAVKW
jgi:DNA polymerase-3 subunit epsilon